MFKKITLHQLFVLAFWIVALLTMRLAEGDSMMHIRIGQYFVEHHTILLQDVFSYTMYGKDWASHEWLYEILMYSLFTQFGFAGLNFFSSGLIAATLLIISYFYLQHKQSFGWLAINLVFAFILMKLHFTPRPHLVTFLFVAIYLQILLSSDKSEKSLWALPPIMLVWTNLHGGYMIGLALIWMFFIVEWAGGFINTVAKIEPTKLKKLLLIACLTTIASIMKPGGLRDILLPFQLGKSSVIPYISEWASFNYYDIWGKIYLLFVVYCITLWGVFRKQERPIYYVLTIFFLSIGFMAFRHMPLTGIALTMLNAQRAPDFSKIFNIADKKKSQQLDESKEAFLNAGIFAVLVLVMVFQLSQYNKRALSQIKIIFPEHDAVEYIKTHALNGRLFNPQEMGGYLIYQTFPRRKVFIDGRVDLYGDVFMREYINLMTLKPGWKTILNKHQFDYMLLKQEHALAQVLIDLKEYRLIYEDANFCILKKIKPMVEIK